MKKIYYVFFFLVILFSIFVYTSCQKSENESVFEKNSTVVHRDPVQNVSIAKDGIATIKTKSGKTQKLNLSDSKKDILLSKTGVLQDSTSKEAPEIQTYVIPLEMKVTDDAMSSISSSEEGGGIPGNPGSPPAQFAYTITRYGGNYSTVTVSPSVLYINDVTVRATILAVVTVGHTVTWDVNFRYTRNGQLIQTTQVTMVSY